MNGAVVKTIKVTVQTQKVGSKCEITFEIEDDATEEEIEEVAMASMFDMIDWNWQVVE